MGALPRSYLPTYNSHSATEDTASLFLCHTVQTNVSLVNPSPAPGTVTEGNQRKESTESSHPHDRELVTVNYTGNHAQELQDLLGAEPAMSGLIDVHRQWTRVW